jgi:hypothetical protein
MININMLSAKRVVLLAAAVVGLGAFAWFADHALTSADAASAAPEAVSAVPTGEVAAFGALRAQSPATDMPASVSRSIDRSLMPKFGASSSLARRVTSPEGTGAIYLIPARDAVCLYVEDLAGDPGTGAATCQPLAQVKSQGGIHLQFVDPASDSPRSPFPPAGTPFKSTIVGVATDDASSVAATSLNGVTHTANVSSDGAFAVTGTGLTELAIGAGGDGARHAGRSALAHG